ncbi:hypothetical protein [Actinoplanes sp. NPDC051851]|uniref:hypothetical protein n=1 Tax=Actinoplanes sp. NPDC051851 TaxID=3154753 RepID=UPI003435257D
MNLPPDDPWGAPSPAPAEPAHAPEPGPVIVEIAEIQITSSLVRTPVGDFPLAGSRWQVNEFWLSQRRTPLWAKIVAGVGVCFTAGFSLLLLLVKETVPQGTVQVTVTSGTMQYVARVPVKHEEDIAQINQSVNYVRSLAAL